jgi:hypothetical protein
LRTVGKNPVRHHIAKIPKVKELAETTTTLLPSVYLWTILLVAES